MYENNNKRVVTIDNKDDIIDTNISFVINNNNNNNNEIHSKSSMDILAAVATEIADKETEIHIPESISKLLNDTQRAKITECYKKAMDAWQHKAKSTLHSTFSSSSSSSVNLLNDKSIMLSSVVFIVGRPFSPNGLLLSQIAESAEIPLENLLSPLSEFIELLNMTKEYGEIIKITIKRFVICSLLREKYSRIIGRSKDVSALLKTEHSSSSSSSLTAVLKSSSGSNNSDEMYRAFMIRLGWLLFVLLKGSASLNEDELQSKLYHLLLCCVNFVVMNSPLGMFSFTDREIFDYNKVKREKKERKKDKKDDVDDNNENGENNSDKMSVCKEEDGCNNDDNDDDEKRDYYYLEVLCTQNGMSYKEILDLQVSVFHPFISKLREDKLVIVKSLNNTRSEAQTEFMSMDDLCFTLSNLNSLYEKKLSSSWEFDERLFLQDVSIMPSPNHPHHIQPSSSSSTLSSNKVLTTPMKSANTTFSAYEHELRARYAAKPTPAAKSIVPSQSRRVSFVGTPVRPPPTPLRATVDMLSWLDGLMKANPGPGPVLARLLRENGVEEQAAELNTKLEELANSLGLVDAQPPPPVLLQSPQLGPSQDSNSNSSNNAANDPHFVVRNDPAKRVAVCLRLFYRLLDSLVRREIFMKGKSPQSTSSKSRISPCNSSSICGEDAKELLASVLSTGPLVRSVLATAAEVVAHAARNSSLAFPAVMRLLKLQPFEFFRILTNIFSLNELFPREIMAHLKTIEAALVDRLAWESSSCILPLYSEVSAAEVLAIAESISIKGSLPPQTSQQHQQQVVRSVPSTPEKKLQSIVAAAPPRTVATTNVATSEGVDAEQKKDAVMHRGFAILLRKLFTISAKKFEVLCRKDCSQALINQMWYVFTHVIAEHKEFIPEHSGTQLVLCAYVGVMRANSRPADLQYAESLIHTPQNLCTGVSISTYPEQPSVERKTGTLQEYYNSIYVRPVSTLIFNARSIFKVQQQSPNNKTGEEAKKIQVPPPTILIKPSPRPMSVRRMRSSPFFSPRRLSFQQGMTPSAAAAASSSSLSTSVFLPPSPSKVTLPPYTEIKARPSKRSLSSTVFPQRTLNFDEINGNDYADDEKSESEHEKDREKGSAKKARYISDELIV